MNRNGARRRAGGWAALLALCLALAGCEQILPELLAPSEPSFSSEASEASESAPPQEMGPARLTMRVIDVGQGEAVLLLSGGQAVLVDAGDYYAGDAVLASLQELGVGRLAAAVNTHPHYDHYGGFAEVLREVPADEFLTTEIPAELAPTDRAYLSLMDSLAASGTPVRALREGDTIPFGEAVATVVGPINTYGTVNDLSLVLRVVCGDTAFLLCGDMTYVPEYDLRTAGVTLSADVLVVGHHGSYSSTKPEFLAAVHPAYAAISVGEDNEYGLPHEETLRELLRQGVTVSRTDLSGCITYTSDGSRVALSVEKE